LPGKRRNLPALKHAGRLADHLHAEIPGERMKRTAEFFTADVATSNIAADNMLHFQVTLGF